MKYFYVAYMYREAFDKTYQYGAESIICRHDQPTVDELSTLCNRLKNKLNASSLIFVNVIPLYSENNGESIKDFHSKDEKKKVEDLTPKSENKLKKININRFVKVKLTKYGKDVYYHRWDALNSLAGRVVNTPDYPTVDPDGFSKFQIHQLMYIYGEYMGLNINQVFDNGAIYLDSDDLEEA